MKSKKKRLEKQGRLKESKKNESRQKKLKKRGDSPKQSAYKINKMPLSVKQRRKLKISQPRLLKRRELKRKKPLN